MATAAEISLWLATKDAPKRLDRVLAQQSPEVQKQVRDAITLYDFAATGGGKAAPFAKPTTVADVDDLYGFDPKTSARVHHDLVVATVTSGLQERMGTDDQLPVPDTSLRDQVEAAFNIHHLEG